MLSLPLDAHQSGARIILKKGVFRPQARIHFDSGRVVNDATWRSVSFNSSTVFRIRVCHLLTADFRSDFPVAFLILCLRDPSGCPFFTSFDFHCCFPWRDPTHAVYFHAFVAW